MKLKRILAASAVAAVTFLCLTGCEEKDTLSKAVMASSSALYFDENGGSQDITIYADADWVVEYPDWISVVPDNGHCVVDVTITVEQNYLDGTPNTPRSYTLVFKGGTIASEAPVSVQQTGDKYRAVKDYTVDQIYDLDDATVVSVPNLIVVCLSTDGFIASNKNSNTFIFVSSDESLNVGDEISLKGDKTSLNGLPEIILDTYETVSTGNTVTLPTPTDITDQFDTYRVTTWEYISVTGSIKSSTTIMTVSGATYSVNMLNAVDDAILGHKVTLIGFYAGFSAPYTRLVVNDYVDIAELTTYYWVDDFEWIYPWVLATGQDVDQVGEKNTSASGMRIDAYYVDGESCTAHLESLGYDFDSIAADGTTNDIDHNYRSVYIWRNYLKFGMTGRQSGIYLPHFTANEGQTVHVSFDWTPFVADPVELRISVINGQREKEYYVPLHDTSNWNWTTVDIALEDAEITEDTQIKIWPIASQWGTYSTTTIYRWFIDNIAVYSNLEE